MRRVAIVVAAAIVVPLLASAPRVPVDAQSASAQLRAVNVAPGVPALNVIVDGQPAIRNVAYARASPYVALNSGAHAAQVQPVSGSTAISSVPLSLAGGAAQTLVASSLSPSGGAFVLNDDNTPPPPGRANVRFVQASPDMPAVDVGVPGQPPIFSGVAFGQSQGPFAVDAPRTYDLEIRLAGTNTVLLHDPNVSVQDGQVVSLVTTGSVQDHTLTWIPVLYSGPGTVVSSMPATGSGGSAPRVRLALLFAPAGLLLLLALVASRRARGLERKPQG